MPTAAKLVAAVIYAALGYLVSDMVKPLLPEGTPTGMMSPVDAAVSALVGWRILGGRAGEGAARGLGYGITATLAAIFWCTLLWAGTEMYEQSLRLRYDGPIEAVTEMFGMMVGYAWLLATTEILVTLAVGTVLAVLAVEKAAARWS